MVKVLESLQDAGTRLRKPKTAGIQRGPSAPEIADSIIKMIEDEVYAPGEPLREQELADRFGVTRARVREGLCILEARGFVVIERMKGARIVRHDSHELVAISQVRGALLAVAARMAAKEGNDEEHREILRLAKDLAKRGPGLIPKEFRAITMQIGVLITNASHSAFVERLVNDVHRARNILRAYRSLGLSSRERRIQASRNWLSVAEAISAGNGVAAARMVNKIYEEALRAIEREIEENELR